jgi:hypothetical protein
MPSADIFYVYEHWRPDTNSCFWVGKGYGDRAYRLKRNFHHGNVVKKLEALGMAVEVRLVQSGLEENAALAFEVERIAFWRAAGVVLANYTDGGEGVCGLKHSEESRAKIREKRARQKVVHSSATIKKIGDAQRGRRRGPNPEHSARLTGRKHSAETRAKMSASRVGRVFSPGEIAKIRSSNKGQKRSASACENMRQAHLGKSLSDDHRAAISAGQMGRKRGPMSEEQKLKISMTKRQRAAA